MKTQTGKQNRLAVWAIAPIDLSAQSFSAFGTRNFSARIARGALQ